MRLWGGTALLVLSCANGMTSHPWCSDGKTEVTAGLRQRRTPPQNEGVHTLPSDVLVRVCIAAPLAVVTWFALAETSTID